jgi:hypothetical protein
MNEMRTNREFIDINTMAEIFAANCTVCKEVRNSERCLKPDSLPCHIRMRSWLEAKAKLLPELLVGDIIYTNSNQYVAIDDVWVVRPTMREKKCICDIEGDVISIYRFDSNGIYQEIWRAENR